MGILIETIDEVKPYRTTALTLKCDGDQHGLFGASQTFMHPDGFMGQYRLAMNAGWKDTHDDHGVRLILGPCCSGKVP